MDKEACNEGINGAACTFPYEILPAVHPHTCLPRDDASSRILAVISDELVVLVYVNQCLVISENWTTHQVFAQPIHAIVFAPAAGLTCPPSLWANS